ncbi:MAG: hypothetical protein C5B57_05350 [Blastocatellia bacterium]|nr:MAG: hypothetical protein C5B57_05350 [Blastocatellia bacterium]
MRVPTQERQMDQPEKVKKTWNQPKLYVHGNVEQITQTPYKQKGLGTHDGLLFSNASSHIRKIS